MMKYSARIVLLFLLGVMISSCNPNTSEKGSTHEEVAPDSSSAVLSADVDTVVPPESKESKAVSGTKADQAGHEPVIMVYNFHLTNRCVSCMAIEDATSKTLKLYFEDAVKKGKIKRKILNVEEEANSKISEKYQAFGSGIFVTQVKNGKEATTDLTGDGFRYARNKEEKFIAILKSTIDHYLAN